MNLRLFMITILVMLLSLSALVARADSDIDLQRDCQLCGMDRKSYGYSRMLLEYKNGVSVGTCSLHCAVTETSSNQSTQVVTYKVADRNTRQLIDAEKAYWTIGGKKRGVMTQRAKWAFATQNAAHTFINTNGGAMASWSEAKAAAREDAQLKLH
jgi:nitrous oxide reductase accessory protein NosL